MFAELSPISEQEFSQIKHDKKYSPNSRAVKFLKGAIDLPLTETGKEFYLDAQTVIRDWDLSTDVENRGAAMSTCVIGAEWLAEQKGEPTPDVADAFYHCADRLMRATGRIDPLWGDVNRHVRGDINLPVGGGPRYLAGYLCSGYGGRWLSNQYSRRRPLLFCLLGRARRAENSWRASVWRGNTGYRVTPLRRSGRRLCRRNFARPAI